MPNPPFRFVHASDLHLELPPLGLAEVPEHLRELFTESAYWAAQRLFDTVLAEEAEFLVLSGDVLHGRHTGPRGPVFLLEQLRRLAERGIPVYWAGGSVDPPEAWPAAVRLPGKVHRFRRGKVEEFLHQRDGTPVARLIGISRDRRCSVRASDFHADGSGLFTIAVVHGAAEAAALKAREIHYWALGGRHQRSTLCNAPRPAHYPGSPQGRRPEEPGPHGCTLVEVDEHGQSRLSLLPTDVMRWVGERIVVDEATGRDDLESMLRERMQTLVETTPAVDLLVSWTVAGSGPLPAQLRRGGLEAELLGWLRREYGYGPPAAWSVSLDVEPAATFPPEWYEQETIRGEFLRAIRRLQVNPDEPIDLESYMAEEYLAGVLSPAATIGQKPARDRVLREAAWLGVDLLSGEESPS